MCLGGMFKDDKGKKLIMKTTDMASKDTLHIV